MSCESSYRRRGITLSTALAAVLLFLILITGIRADNGSMAELMQKATSRKVLTQVPAPDVGGGNRSTLEMKPVRIWRDKCSLSDVMVSQGQSEPLPNGIPTYTVEITNVCVSGCDIDRIFLSCGWFSSARVVNPRVFRRLAYDVCLVNEGMTLRNGQSLSFRYANTYSYPLAVLSLSCYS